jgi:hypothetical protein
VAADLLETTPASGGGEAAVARPPRLKFRRAQVQFGATSDCASLSDTI